MAGKNRIVRTVSEKSLFPSAKNVVDATVSHNQGDLLILSGGLLAAAASEADGEFMLGIAVETIVDGKLASPYVTDVDGSVAASEIPGPSYGVVAKLVLKTGDALAEGGLVYLNPAAGTHHVQAAGTKAIGVNQGPAIASAAAGQEIEVLIGCRAPDDILKF